MILQQLPPTEHMAQEDYKESDPFSRTTRDIAATLDNMAKGQTSGQYPALDAIFGKRRTTIHQERPDTYRQPRHRFNNRKNFRSRRRLIDDVYPALPERVAVVEHIAKELNKDFDQHRQESIKASAGYVTKEELKVITNQIDKEIVPSIADIKNKQVLRQILLVISLLLSAAGNVIAVYRFFSTHAL